MSKIVCEVNRTYKYGLYDNGEANSCLHDTINVSEIIWNHITGKHLASTRLQKHVSHLRMRTQRFGVGIIDCTDC